MKRLLLILLLILPFTSFAADLNVLYVTAVKNVRNAKEAMIYFKNEKALASQFLNDYEPAYQTIVKEKKDGTFDVKYIFTKRKGKQ